MSNGDAKDGRETGCGELSPENRAAFKKRASELGKQLDDVKSRKLHGPEHNGARGAAMGQAMKIAAELVAGVGVGAFIGWFLDTQFGTRPWLMMVFLILGFCAGMLNVIRTAQRMQEKAEPLQRAAPSIEDDEEDR